MTSEETLPLLCGQCHAKVYGRIEADGTKMVRCPKCGAEDSLEEAAREAAEYKVDKIFKSAFKGLGSSAPVKAPLDGSGERSYRFITEDG